MYTTKPQQNEAYYRSIDHLTDSRKYQGLSIAPPCQREMEPENTVTPSRPDSQQQPVIQRVVGDYKKGTKLRRNTIVMQGLTEGQMAMIQKLHDDDSVHCTINEARKLVGAEPLATSSSDVLPPFPFRYAESGDEYMADVVSGPGGFVQYPREGLPEAREMEGVQISVVSGSTYSDLPTSSHRAITQATVMDGVSPNEAARVLGLPCPSPLSWEWLHLVAFSIQGTHIDSISAQSLQLMERTNQPQQIRENLVLGSAGANTAMLTYETVIKQIMRDNPSWKLSLFVAAHKEDHDVRNSRGETVKIPVCHRIDYHFYFITGDGKVIPPVVLAFSPLSPDKPLRSEYSEVVADLSEHIKNALAVPVLPTGIRTEWMYSLK